MTGTLALELSGGLSLPPVSVVSVTNVDIQAFSKEGASTDAESLAAPKIGTVLRIRDKWQKCPYLAPIFTI